MDQRWNQLASLFGRFILCVSLGPDSDRTEKTGFLVFTSVLVFRCQPEQVGSLSDTSTWRNWVLVCTGGTEWPEDYNTIWTMLASMACGRADWRDSNCWLLMSFSGLTYKYRDSIWRHDSLYFFTSDLWGTYLDNIPTAVLRLFCLHTHFSAQFTVTPILDIGLFFSPLSTRLLSPSFISCK